MPGPGSWGNLAKKRVIPFKKGKKEGNRRRMAQAPDEKIYFDLINPDLDFQMTGGSWGRAMVTY